LNGGLSDVEISTKSVEMGRSEGECVELVTSVSLSDAGITRGSALCSKRTLVTFASLFLWDARKYGVNPPTGTQVLGIYIRAMLEKYAGNFWIVVP